MIIAINIGRLAMVAWAIYSLILIFMPAWVHQEPDQKGGIIQFILAYGIGYGLDRLLSVVRRRKAARADSDRGSGVADADAE